jgi:hypothetical protein
MDPAGGGSLLSGSAAGQYAVVTNAGVDLGERVEDVGAADPEAQVAVTVRGR